MKAFTTTQYASYDSQENVVLFRENTVGLCSIKEVWANIQEGEDYFVTYHSINDGNKRWVEIYDRENNYVHLEDIDPGKAVILFATMIGMKAAAQD